MTLSPKPAPGAANGLWAIEDWWSVFIGLAAVAAAAIAFRMGNSLNYLAVMPRAWAEPSDLWAQLRHDGPRYLGLGSVMLLALMPAALVMKQRPSRFVAALLALFGLAMLVLIATAWESARRFYLEPPLIALLTGLLVGNVAILPAWLEAGFRTEFFIKIAVVLLGATLPLPLFLTAGPVAILQAAIVATVTFLVIFWIARFLDIDRRLAAMLAGGGSICGVSAVLAIAAAVRARREDVSIATTIVVIWALVMIVLLPVLAKAWYLPAGIGGAWIGTSELADAAGFAAAQTFSRFIGPAGLPGSPDQVLWSYTLVKVIGRDMWIGVWAALLSFIAVTRWEPRDGRPVDLSQIWRRFPKFILGFVAASVLLTVASTGYDFDTAVRARLVAPIESLRNWAFTFSFLSIGASMRVRHLAPVSGDAFVAFSAGVVINLVLGFVLSAVVFASYWEDVAR